MDGVCEGVVVTLQVRVLLALLVKLFVGAWLAVELDVPAGEFDDDCEGVPLSDAVAVMVSDWLRVSEPLRVPVALALCAPLRVYVALALAVCDAVRAALRVCVWLDKGLELRVGDCDVVYVCDIDCVSVRLAEEVAVPDVVPACVRDCVCERVDDVVRVTVCV